MMIWLIAKKEFHENWINHRIKLAFALCVILLAVSLWLGLKDYSGRLSSYSIANSEDAVFLDRIATYIFFNDRGEFDGSSSIGDLIEPIGVYRRPAELSIFARGMEDRMNRPVKFVDIRKMGLQAQISTGNKQERNKMFALFSPPDFLYISRVVLSLLTILFAFSAIAGERENGTLKLMLSNPISRGQLLLGKFLGGYASIIVPFIAAALIALLLVALSPSVDLNGASWMRIFLIMLISLVYIAVFFFVGLAISALARRSSTAVLLLLAIWIVLTLVVPNVGWLTAKRLAEVPSQQQVETEKFKTARQIEDEEEKKHPSQSFMPGYGRYHIEAQPEIGKAMKAIDERYEALRHKLLIISKILTRLSPVGAYVYAITGLAQTGIEDEIKYNLQLKQYESLINEENKKMTKKAFSGAGAGNPPPTADIRNYYAWRVKHDESMYSTFRDGYSSLADLTFERESLSGTMQAIRTDLLLLIVWMGLGFIFAMLTLVKCEVR